MTPRLRYVLLVAVGLTLALGAVAFSRAQPVARQAVDAPGGAMGATKDAPEAFPRTLEDGMKRTVRLPSAPKRIVSLAPSTTEILFALGAGDRVVGVTRYCTYPPEAQKVPQVGGLVDPNYEQIVAMRPDLVILSYLQDTRRLARLEALGLRVIVLNPEGLSRVFDDIRLVGQALGKEEAAERIVATMRREQAEVEALVSRKPEAERPRVLMLYGSVAAGVGSFAGDMLTEAGGQNVARVTGTPWPVLSHEYLVRADPQILVLVDDSDVPKPQRDPEALERLRNDPAFRHLAAVREGRVYRMSGSLLQIPGPRIVQALRQLADLLAEEAPN